jgi:hypothetical protein
MLLWTPRTGINRLRTSKKELAREGLKVDLPGPYAIRHDHRHPSSHHLEATDRALACWFLVLWEAGIAVLREGE